MQSKGLLGLLFRSKNLSFEAFSGPNRPQEGLEKAPGSGPNRFAPIFKPVDQFQGYFVWLSEPRVTALEFSFQRERQ